MVEEKRIWISWWGHRRSLELAQALGVPFVYRESRQTRIIRYPVLLAWTLGVLFKERPHIVFCQNPSIVLTGFLVLLKGLFSYRLVVDRHSNFKFLTRGSASVKWRIFHCLSAYTLRNAEVTIVTTRKLAKWVHACGGRAVVLHDRIPDLSTNVNVDLAGAPSVLFVCTYSPDEPIGEVLESVKTMPAESVIYITGRAPEVVQKLTAELNRDLGASRVILTGFLSENDYRAYMKAANVVVVLTTVEDVLVCGGYEAVSLGKPLVLSGSKAIRGLFNRGVIYCDNSAQDISEAVAHAHKERLHHQDEIACLRNDLRVLWAQRFSMLREAIDNSEPLRLQSGWRS